MPGSVCAMDEVAWLLRVSKLRMHRLSNGKGLNNFAEPCKNSSSFVRQYLFRGNSSLARLHFFMQLSFSPPTGPATHIYATIYADKLGSTDEYTLLLGG